MPIKNFDTILTDINDKPIKEKNESGEEKELIIKNLVVNALSASFQDEAGLSGEKKFSRGLLATKIHAGGDIDVKPEEIVEIKSLIGKAYAPLIVYKIYSFLDE